MFKYQIIDRREEHSDKTPGSRQRFIERYKSVIKGAAADKIQEAKGFISIANGKDGQENEVKIKRKSIEEEQFQLNSKTGEHYYTIPGNDQYRVGDLILRPEENSGDARPAGSDQGEGEDSFSFYLNREEFLNLILEDLELPDMIKQNLIHSITEEWVNAGHTRSGSPGNMDIGYSMRRAIGRRIGLKRKSRKQELEKLREELAALLAITDDQNESRILQLNALIAVLESKLRSIPYIDPDQDIRYRNRDVERKPLTSAAMFCLMDVSGSMTQNLKANSKHFFMLLYLFLLRQYNYVQVVFVRHTTYAEEVDEETFFYDKATGGTIVSSGLVKIVEIIKERFDPNNWNIYVAQASDGDNYGTDSERCKNILLDQLLPLLQYMVYVEMSDGVPYASYVSDLWSTYERVKENATDSFEMKKISEKSQIYPVFHNIFSKKTKGTKV